MRACLLAALWMFAGQALAADPALPPTAESGLEHVRQGKLAAYQDMLHRFDAAAAAAPDDPGIAAARCEYIAQFTDEEDPDWVESAPDDLDACSESISAKWPKAPAVLLFQLEQSWGEESVDFGKAHAKDIAAWPAPLRRRAYAHLSSVYRYDDDDTRGNDYAWRAVQLGETALLPEAIDHLVAHRRYAEAERLLARTPPEQESWRARRRIEAALKLPDARIALRELARHDAARDREMARVAARTLLRAGDIKAARARLAGYEPKNETERQAVFEVALAARDVPVALAAIDLTDTDAFLANMGRFLMLASTAPSTLASPTMLGFTVAFLLMLVAIALFPGLLLVPVHYRGLVRRVRNKPAMPLFERVGLRHAWYAAAVALCVPVLVQAVVDPNSFADAMDGEGGITNSPALFRLLWWSTLAGLVCLLPGMRWVGAPRMIGDRALWRGAWWKVGLAIAGVWAVGLLLSLYHGATGGGGDTLHTQMLDNATQAGRASFGVFATFLLIAVIVPVFEELTFRGLVLGGLTRHIGFWWANVAQALVFAAVHDDAPRFVFYFALGLAGGWLVKSTKSLAPAIALHMINNGAVFLLGK